MQDADPITLTRSDISWAPCIPSAKSVCRIALLLLAAVAFAWAQPLYTISTVAGGVSPTTPLAATSAAIGGVPAIAVDSSGNYYFSSQLHCVFRVTPSSGTLTLLAGTCRPGFSGDNGNATSAQLNTPSGIAVDPSGNVYIADRNNNRIRKVTPGGIISTVAGNGSSGYSGDNGQAVNAQLNGPTGIALDSSGNLYIADSSNNVVRKVANGVITTIAGIGLAGYSGDGAAATSAQLNSPTGIAFDSTGNVYIAEIGNNVVRKITGAVISTVAGSGVQGTLGDGGSATAARLSAPTGIAFDGSNNLYIADTGNNRVRIVSGGVINPAAGTGAPSFSGDGGTATSATLTTPTGVARDSSGSVYISDSGNNRIRKIAAGIIATVAGTGAATSSPVGALLQANSVAVDASGNLYIADTGNQRIRKITPSGTVTTLAGTGIPGFSGDGGVATSAQLSFPNGVAVDASGNVFVADTANQRVREITVNGNITTIAGNGTTGFSGDGAAATSAQLWNPVSVAVDAGGTVYISDSSNSRVRKVSAGVITTVAGNGTPGYIGEGAATSSELSFPAGIAVDTSGTLFIADQFNSRIRRVSGGIISTVAGNGLAGFAGDGGLATSAQLSLPYAVAVDASGHFYISDNNNNRVRYVSGGNIFTIAGNGVAGYTVEGLAASAALLHPAGIAVDSSGNVYFAEPGGSDVRRLTPSSPAPVLSAVLSHTGVFSQGQNGALFTATVSNEAGAQPTVGTVTVIQIVPAGLTLVSMSGSGWTCPPGGNSCTRTDALAAGSSYPPIAVTVNVGAAAAVQVTHQVTVSGGGSAIAGASDTANVTAACVVTVVPLSPGVSAAASTLTLTLNNGVCGWSASSNAPWLTPTASSGSGASLPVTVAANATGAQRTGSLTVAGQTVNVTQAGIVSGAGGPPSLVSLNPFQGTGLSANLTFVYADNNGWAAIASAEFIVNPRWEPNSRPGGCYVKHAPSTGLFTLIADDGISVAGATAPGSGGSISNSQCTLNGAASSAAGSGNNLTLVAALTFSPNFTGQRHIWMQASDYNNLSSNWLVYGVWFPTQTTFTTGPWFRIYDPNSKSYLYSADPNEYAFLGSQGFVQQGISGLIMTGPGSVSGVSNLAFYRVFVAATSSHFWTSDRNEFLYLISLQNAYVGEGVATFIMPYLNAQGQVSPQVTNSIPFYRAAFQGANLHFWTSDPNEYFGTGGEHLPAGYLGEGIASYVFPASGAQLGSAQSFVQPMVMNGASNVSNGTVTPGQVLTISGHRGGRVLLNGKPAQVIGVQGNALRILVPSDLGDAAEVNVEVDHQRVTLTVAAADPALFVTTAYGRGHAQTREQGPVAPGSIVTLYATGLGNNLPLEAHIAGQPAEVVAVTPSATRPGVTEVQLRVPYSVPPADFQPVVLHIGNLFTQPGVSLAIQ